MTKQAADHRARMVYVAAQKLREQGVAGAALRQVAAEAGAPRGSLQHYFPGGKDQLVAESLTWAGEFAASRVEAYLARARKPRPSTLFADLVEQWITELEARGFARGCPVNAALADCAGVNEVIRRAADDALSAWQGPIREALTQMGVPARRASSLTTLILASLEGAITLARAGNTSAPLRTVARELGPLLDAASSSDKSGRGAE